MCSDEHLHQLVAVAMNGPRGVNRGSFSSLRWKWNDLFWSIDRDLAGPPVQTPTSYGMENCTAGPHWLVGQLHAENVNSLVARYGDARSQYELEPQHWFDARMDAVETIKACHCYSYQACEHSGWEDSLAHAFTNALVMKVSHHVVGYDEAPWGWDKVNSDAHKIGISLTDIMNGRKPE
jgi:hypothetical protein